MSSVSSTGRVRFVDLNDVDFNSYSGRNNNVLIVDSTGTGINSVNGAVAVGGGVKNDIPMFNDPLSAPPVLVDSGLQVVNMPTVALGIDFNPTMPETSAVAYVDSVPAMAIITGSNVTTADIVLSNQSVTPSAVVIENKSIGGFSALQADTCMMVDTTNNNYFYNDNVTCIMNESVDGHILTMNSTGVNLSSGSGLPLNIDANDSIINSSNVQLSNPIYFNGFLKTDLAGNISAVAGPTPSLIQLSAVDQPSGSPLTVPLSSNNDIQFTNNVLNGGLGILWGVVVNGAVPNPWGFTAPAGGGVFEFNVTFSASILDFLASFRVLYNTLTDYNFGQLNTIQGGNSLSFIYNMMGGDFIEFNILTAGFFPVTVTSAYCTVKQLQPHI